MILSVLIYAEINLVAHRVDAMTLHKRILQLNPSGKNRTRDKRESSASL